MPPKLVEGVQGECRLSVALNAAGKPGDVTPLECPPELEAAAVKAVSKWRWTPPTIDGVRVPASTEVVLRFR